MLILDVFNYFAGHSGEGGILLCSLGQAYNRQYNVRAISRHVWSGERSGAARAAGGVEQAARHGGRRGGRRGRGGAGGAPAARRHRHLQLVPPLPRLAALPLNEYSLTLSIVF